MPPTISSIDFESNGEEWTATVGQKLHGIKRTSYMRNGVGLERTQRLEDEATVTSITQGENNVCTVTTNKWPLTEARSAFENPFWAGVPAHIRYAD